MKNINAGWVSGACTGGSHSAQWFLMDLESQLCSLCVLLSDFIKGPLWKLLGGTVLRASKNHLLDYNLHFGLNKIPFCFLTWSVKFPSFAWHGGQDIRDTHQWTPGVCSEPVLGTSWALWAPPASWYSSFLRNDQQEAPIDKADLIWFTDGSYLKDEQRHYRAGYEITSTVNINESSYLPETKSTQQAKSIALTWAF